MPQETSRLSSRIKSKFSLQLLTASLCSVQIADLKILDESKEAKSKKGGKKNVLATIQSPMELEETLSYESFKNKISLDTALENVPWGTGLYWRGNEQDELIL